MHNYFPDAGVLVTCEAAVAARLPLTGAPLASSRCWRRHLDGDQTHTAR